MPINRDSRKKHFLRAGFIFCLLIAPPKPPPSSHQGSLLSRRYTQRSQHWRKKRQDAVIAHLACHSPLFYRRLAVGEPSSQPTKRQRSGKMDDPKGPQAG